MAARRVRLRPRRVALLDRVHDDRPARPRPRRRLGLACVRRRIGQCDDRRVRTAWSSPGRPPSGTAPSRGRTRTPELALDSIAADGLHFCPAPPGRTRSTPTCAVTWAGRSGAGLRAGVPPGTRRTGRSRPAPRAPTPRYALRDDPSPRRATVPPAGPRVADTVDAAAREPAAWLGALTLALRRRSSPTARLLGALGVGALASWRCAAQRHGRGDVQPRAARASRRWPSPASASRSCSTAPAAAPSSGGSWSARSRPACWSSVVDGSGLGTALTGPATPPISTGSGEDYERFSISTGEQAAAQWLGRRLRPAPSSTPTATPSCGCSRSRTAAPRS